MSGKGCAHTLSLQVLTLHHDCHVMGCRLVSFIWPVPQRSRDKLFLLHNCHVMGCCLAKSAGVATLKMRLNRLPKDEPPWEVSVLDHFP